MVRCRSHCPAERTSPARMQLENDSPEPPSLSPSPLNEHNAMQSVAHSGVTRLSAWSAGGGAGGALPPPPADTRLGSVSCPDLGSASQQRHGQRHEQQTPRPRSDWEMTRRNSDRYPSGPRAGSSGVWSANLSVSRLPAAWSQSARRDTIHVSNPHMSRRDMRKMSDLGGVEPAGGATRCRRRPSARSSRSPRPAPEELPRSPPPPPPDVPVDADVPQLVLSPRPPLARHASDTRLLMPQPGAVPPAHADDVALVMEHLYVGSAAAAHNQWLLCRLSVVAVVELSETEPRAAPPACPCVCPRHATHHRQRLRISVRDHPDEDLRPFVAQMNRFIDAHRRRGGGVLVHSAAGRSRAPAVVLQYIMHAQGVSLMAACERLSRCWPSAQPNQGFFRQLVELDGERRAVSAPAEVAAARQPTRAAARRAWD